MNIAGFLSGGIVKQFTDPLLAAYQSKLSAENNADRIEADVLIEKIETARDLALAEAADRWSATRLGRLGIVLPFCLWWSAVFIDSTFDLSLVVLALPKEIMQMALVLIPAIVIGQVAETALKRRK